MGQQKTLSGIRTFATDKKLSKNTETKNTSDSEVVSNEKENSVKTILPKPPVKKASSIPKPPVANTNKKIPTPPLRKKDPVLKPVSIPTPKPAEIKASPKIEEKQIKKFVPTKKPFTEEQVVTFKETPAIKKFDGKRRVNKDLGPATIITDTKKDRFKLLPAITTSVKSWFEENKKAYEESKKPKYSVPETTRRKGVIQRATSITGASAVSDHSMIHERIRERKERKEQESLSTTTSQPEKETHTIWTANTEAGYPLLQKDNTMNVKMHPRKSFLTTNNEIVVTGLKNQSKSNTKKEILTTLTTDKGEHEEIKTTPSIPKQQTIEDKKSTWDKEEQKDFILDPNSVETAEPLATNTKPDTEKAPNDTKPKESLTWEEVVKNQTKELNNPPETTSAEIPLDVKPDQTETPWGENATTDIQTSTNISPLDANPVADTPQEEIKKEKTLVEIPTWGEEQKTVPSTETETISQEEVLDVKPTPEDNAWKVEEEELLVPPTPPTPSSPSAISANEIGEETPTEAATTKTWEEVAETAQVSEPENVQTPPQYIEEIPETEPIVEVYDTEKEIPKKRISLRSLLFSIDINVLVFYIFTFIITIAVIVLNLDFESKINIKDTSEIPVTEQPLLIKAPLKIIHIPSLNKGSILTAIGNLRNNTQTEISQLALALNKEKTSLVPANILLPIIDIDLEPNFASSITHLYFGDVRNEQPFIVMKVADHDISKGGMFIWEKSMYNDLRPIFKNYVNPTEDTAVTAKFYDATLNDTDLRVLEDGDGNEKLIYGFVNPDTIIITADSIIMSELIQLK